MGCDKLVTETSRIPTPFDMYYDADKTLSRNRLFNFVIGPRGAGKTYGAKKRVIKNFLKDGSQFIYLRRYETEMPTSQMRNFFSDVSQEFPDTEFSCFNATMKINGKVAGWYFPLSKGNVLKSIPFPNVKLIIFDEFIINTGMVRYLTNEVVTFLETYSTIARDRDVPVLFLANSITFINPYFVYFNISMEKGQRVKLMKDISVELYENPEFTEHMKNTRFGRIIANTSYGNYAIENEFLLDTDSFIEKLPKNAQCGALLKFGSVELGMYTTPGGYLYLAETYDPTCIVRLVVKEHDHDESTILAPRNNPVMLELAQKFAIGYVRFTTQKAKNTTYDILKGWL